MATKINRNNSSSNNNQETTQQIYQLSNNKIGLAILPESNKDNNKTNESQKISITKRRQASLLPSTGNNKNENGATTTNNNVDDDGNSGKITFKSTNDRTGNDEGNIIDNNIETPVEIRLPKTLIQDAYHGNAISSNNNSIARSIQLVYFTDDSLFPVMPLTKNASTIKNVKVVSGVFSLKVRPLYKKTHQEDLVIKTAKKASV